MAKSKAVRLQEALDKIEEGWAALVDLTDEVEQARDNMSGTNLEATERYQKYDDAVDVLRQACDDIESAKGNVEDVEL